MTVRTPTTTKLFNLAALVVLTPSLFLTGIKTSNIVESPMVSENPSQYITLYRVETAVVNYVNRP